MSKYGNRISILGKKRKELFIQFYFILFVVSLHKQDFNSTLKMNITLY